MLKPPELDSKEGEIEIPIRGSILRADWSEGQCARIHCEDR